MLHKSEQGEVVEAGLLVREQQAPTREAEDLSGAEPVLEADGAGESSGDVVNIAMHLPRMARLQPTHPAVVCTDGYDAQGRARYVHFTYAQLDRDSDVIAWGLEELGIVRGTKTILMVKPSLEFFSLTFALFKVGAVPVMIDPGMGLKRMLHCLQETQAEAFVGIPAAQAVRVVFGGYFSSVRTFLTVGKRWFWGGPTLASLRERPWRPYPIAQTRREEQAAILFTTGSTGPAKGAVYEHGIFDAQVAYLRDHFGIQPGEVDLSTFPLFALFAPALGMTSVVPDMNPTRPADVDPVKIIAAIQDRGATTMFGSPALLNRVGRYGKAHGIDLPSLKRVISAGAPVPHATLETFQTLLPEGARIHTPYGATEGLPVCSMATPELLTETREQTALGKGVCVGHPMQGLTLRLIQVTDEPIPHWSDDLLVPDGEIGEIVVKGPNITKAYYNKPEANAKAKIQEGDETCHRMGDVGWRDEEGRIWVCGRKTHRVQTSEHGTMYTIPCEAIFNRHPDVFRSALVGVGKAPHERPVMLVELEKSARASMTPDKEQRLLQALSVLASEHPHTRPIEKIMIHPGFPVDIRHNAKIFREKLKIWAYERR